MEANADTSSGTKRFIMLFFIPLVFQAATTFGFILPAGASSPSPNNILQNKNVASQFNVATKSPIQPVPSTAVKIRSVNLSREEEEKKTLLHASSSSATETTPERDSSITSDQKNDSSDEPLRGEHESNIISRLLYTYASQLLKISSKRQIEISDALPVPEHTIMDGQVPKLERIYTKCKAKAQRQLEKLKSSSTSLESSSSISSDRQKRNLKRKLNEKISKSESLVLAKAIMIHQKNNLIRTGVLRLTNTLIQAFPAILVSRLLRLIESGDAHHPSKPIIAAVQLIALLSVKMIVENLYFHNVVKCATMVRGSLTGLVFDKSLRLSSSSGSGGSSNGVSNNTDDDKDGGDTGDGKKKKKSKDKKSLGTGGVLNLMQSDVSVIEATALQIHTIWGE